MSSGKKKESMTTPPRRNDGDAFTRGHITIRQRGLIFRDEILLDHSTIVQSRSVVLKVVPYSMCFFVELVKVDSRRGLRLPKK